MDPSNQIQKLGQQEYRRKNYHAALNFFNSVIATEKQLDVSVLDCRAATYEKLGDLHTALKDGRRMISDYKTDCAGYLRTGKILQLLDKDSVALGIYKYGLRNVSSSASQYQLLRDIHDSVNQKCGPRKARDPLTVLPVEIAQMIMSYMDFKHVVSLTRVSTTWRDYLKSTPGLWATLDFSKAKADVPKTAIQKYIRFSRGTVSRLTTRQSINLQHVVTQCKSLEHLEIGGGYSNASLIKAASVARNLRCLLLPARCETSLDCVSQILGVCKNLVRAEFHSVTSTQSIHPRWQGDMSRLRTLVVKVTDVQGSKPSFDSLMHMIPDIRELSLRGWKSKTTIPPANAVAMTRLEKLQLADFKGCVNPLALSALRTLDLDTCINVLHSFVDQGSRPDLRTDGIAELSLSCASDLSLECLVWLLGPKFDGLRKLHLPQCTEITDVGLRNLIDMGLIDHVVDLDLSGPRLTDSLIQLLAFRAFRLERIKVASTAITGVGVKALVTKPGSKLQYLDITDCMHVASDAVAFARHLKGLKVKCGQEEFRGKKKKIRFE
ncbi:MAG: hypothetical protein L6R42_002625 [Xanthoria sp. 1 TBL-2021]|nr:MAG: hypothetical protein L6R42_002625 [Xanthoria sp. 1 TBL-2021]